MPNYDHLQGKYVPVYNQITRNVLLNVVKQDTIWLGHFFVDKIKIKKYIELNLMETYDHNLWIDQK